MRKFKFNPFLSLILIKSLDSHIELTRNSTKLIDRLGIINLVYMFLIVTMLIDLFISFINYLKY